MNPTVRGILLGILIGVIVGLLIGLVAQAIFGGDLEAYELVGGLLGLVFGGLLGGFWGGALNLPTRDH